MDVDSTRLVQCNIYRQLVCAPDGRLSFQTCNNGTNRKCYLGGNSAKVLEAEGDAYVHVHRLEDTHARVRPRVYA